MTTSKTPRPGFTSETIVAILDAAAYGGRYSDVIQRSGTDVAPTTLGHWVQKGRRQRDAGEKTALAAFYDLWEVAYPSGGGNMSEAKKMNEIRQAAKVIQERAKKTTTEDMPELQPGYDMPRSLTCECGAAKGRSEKLCRKCLVEKGQL